MKLSDVSSHITPYMNTYNDRMMKSTNRRLARFPDDEHTSTINMSQECSQLINNMVDRNVLRSRINKINSLTPRQSAILNGPECGFCQRTPRGRGYRRGVCDATEAYCMCKSEDELKLNTQDWNNMSSNLEHIIEEKREGFAEDQYWMNLLCK